jgi:hypothetical protein
MRLDTTAPLFTRRLRLLLWTGFILTLLVALLLATRFVQWRKQIETRAFDNAWNQGVTSARAIDRTFREATAIGNSIARDLANGTLAHSDLEKRIRMELAARPQIDGIAIAFQPYAYSPAMRLYQVYLHRKEDGELDMVYGSTYDYTAPPSDKPGAPKTLWYQRPLRDGASWGEPFLATGARKVLIEYGTPFFYREPNGGAPAGVVTIDYSLQDMREMLAQLELSATGYGFVYTNKGTFLAHPDRHLVVQTSLFNSAESGYDEEVCSAARRALNGEPVSLEYTDPVSERTAWMFFRSIPITNWAVGVVMNKVDYLPPARLVRQKITPILLFGTTAIFFVVTLLVHLERRTISAFWVSSIAFSLLCLACIVTVCALATGLHRYAGLAVTNSTAVERYLERYRRGLKRAETVYQIPTGITLSTISFPDAKSAAVSGFIWQRYAASMPKDVQRAFLLPQQVDGDPKINEVQRVLVGKDEVIVWYFGATLQQDFDPTRFPLDYRDIIIRILPKELRRNVVLVPDFPAYALLNPPSMPGVSRDIPVINWRLLSSFFGYQTVNYTTNMGIPARTERSDIPVLLFHVMTRRNFLGPFIVYLLPGLVIAGLFFAYLVSHKETEEINLISGLAYMAALFFVIAVAHAGLREAIAAVGITFLDCLYLLLYFAGGYLVLDMFVVVKYPHLWFIRYNRNLVAKLLYWPLFCVVLLFSTFSTFVYGGVN